MLCQSFTGIKPTLKQVRYWGYKITSPPPLSYLGTTHFKDSDLGDLPRTVYCCLNRRDLWFRQMVIKSHASGHGGCSKGWHVTQTQPIRIFLHYHFFFSSWSLEVESSVSFRIASSRDAPWGSTSGSSCPVERTAWDNTLPGDRQRYICTQIPASVHFLIQTIVELDARH